MENELINYISRFISLSEDEIKAITELVPITTFPKGTVLLKEGEISRTCYFNLKGLVRQYYLVDGDEKTTYFYTEEQAINSFESATQQIPSKHYLACVEDCTLVVGSLDAVPEFYAKFPKIEAFTQLIVAEDFGRNQELLATYMIHSPEERYLNLLKNRPGLINRVPQYQLASYLGVTPESLSRIRKRIVITK
jgi:CRP-like cAMP-binding protein